MKTRLLALYLLGGGGLALLPYQAASQAVLNPAAMSPQLVMPRPTGQAFAPVKSVVAFQSRDTRNDIGPDLRPRTPTAPLNATSALSRFRLGFANGDHHIREITVLRSGDKAKGVLADGNGDDNFSFTAAWWNIPGAVGGEVSSRQTGPTWQAIDIPAGPPNTTLALAGFSMRADSDAEIIEFGVTLKPETLKAEMNMSLARGSSRDSAFDYVLQYVWIPNSMIEEARLITGNGTGSAVRLPEGANGTLPSNDRHVLQSFIFRYDNNYNAENLLRLGVHLEQPYADRGRPSDIVSWEDNDRNERIYWQVKYLSLK
jgi:hypothetical protein